MSTCRSKSNGGSDARAALRRMMCRMILPAAAAADEYSKRLNSRCTDRVRHAKTLFNHGKEYVHKRQARMPAAAAGTQISEPEDTAQLTGDRPTFAAPERVAARWPASMHQLVKVVRCKARFGEKPQQTHASGQQASDHDWNTARRITVDYSVMFQQQPATSLGCSCLLDSTTASPSWLQWSPLTTAAITEWDVDQDLTFGRPHAERKASQDCTLLALDTQ